MERPTISNIREYRDSVTAFGGYNHTDGCPEGQFYELNNITSDFYPVMATRKPRAKVKSYTNLQGIIVKEGKVIAVDDGRLIVDGEAVSGLSLATGDKIMGRMGAYVVVLPDNIYYNTKDATWGHMDASYEKTISVSLSLVNTKGEAITWHDDAYYSSHNPSNGDYKMSNNDGKTILSVYSSATSLWASVPTTYFKISATGIGKDFDKGDGVEVQLDLSGQSWAYSKNIFINDDGSGKRSNNFVIHERGDDYIIVTGLLDANKSFQVPISVKRKVPEMSFIVECQNRLWGCAKDGHEVYCCKLGDLKNWYCYAGISTDSYAATIGTDGEFTGAFTYMGYPIFFKEDSLIKVTVSSTGAHQIRDIACRGVQKGSEKSLCMVDELLYFKANDGICVYDGSFPTKVSDALGVVRYSNAVGGSMNGRYYISMTDSSGKDNLFVYNTKKGIWTKEDGANVREFYRLGEELYLISGNDSYQVIATSNESVPWMVESGTIGYSSADKKYLRRMSIRMSLALGSVVSLYVQYDSDGIWRSIFNMSGKGTQSFTVPFPLRRCDHFKYKLVGKGECKVYSITKSYEEGSDI